MELHLVVNMWLLCPHSVAGLCQHRGFQVFPAPRISNPMRITFLHSTGTKPRGQASHNFNGAGAALGLPENEVTKSSQYGWVARNQTQSV